MWSEVFFEGYCSSHGLRFQRLPRGRWSFDNIMHHLYPNGEPVRLQIPPEGARLMQGRC